MVRREMQFVSIYRRFAILLTVILVGWALITLLASLTNFSIIPKVLPLYTTPILTLLFGIFLSSILYLYWRERKIREQLMEEQIQMARQMELSQRGEETLTSSVHPYLDVSNLPEDPSQFFESDVWEWLPEDSKQDIEESIISLTSGSPTASVILSTRAFEYCLIDWFRNVTDEKIDESEPTESVLDNEETISWSEVAEKVDELQDVSFFHLFQYVRNKRNDVAHSRHSPDEYEAILILFIVNQLIYELFMWEKDKPYQRDFSSDEKPGETQSSDDFQQE